MKTIEEELFFNKIRTRKSQKIPSWLQLQRDHEGKSPQEFLRAICRVPETLLRHSIHRFDVFFLRDVCNCPPISTAVFCPSVLC
ncbi:hypothetical protein TNCT_678841 [Trichonephila clavata]|uniref:Uncharacterized protein n=1 Tax=Trichonephila clavata TaxID=2740835 RepID=A0A8X6L5T5_TRICU|nr:hypothetical protein TNCT_678841 [Trichonephila clavata]